MVVSITKIKENILSKEDQIIPEITKADCFLLDFKQYNLEEIESEIELQSLLQDSGTMLKLIAQQSEPELIKGYKENYFNEIIQNANDLSAGTSITFDMKNDNGVYSCTATYDDPGFKVSNIVSFCNRGFSDKKRASQTGKYGVGIKSLFAFVDSFEITNNIELKIFPRNKIKDVIPLKLASSNPGKTKLSFSFTNRVPEDIFDFNIKKLANFIDLLTYGHNYWGIKKFFTAESESEVLFELQSLLFMDAKKQPGQLTINTIIFNNAENGNKVEICCNKKKDGRKKINDDFFMTKCMINITSQINGHTFTDEYEYALFELKNMRIAIPYKEIIKKKNKYFSTFFVKLDEGNGYDYWNINAAIHTEHANLSRTDFADSPIDRKKITENIKDNLQLLLAKIAEKNEVEDPEYRIILSEIFHRLLINDTHEKETTLFDSVIEHGLTNRYLVKDTKLSEEVAIVKRNPNEKIGYEKIERHFVKEYEATIKQVERIFEEEVKNKNPFKFLDEFLLESDLLESVKAAYICENLNKKEYLSILNKYSRIEDLVINTLENSREQEISSNVIDYLIEKYENNFSELLIFFGIYSLVPGIDHNGHFKSYKGQFKDVLFQNNNLNKNRLDRMIVSDYEKYEIIKNKLTCQYYLQLKNNKYSNCLKFIGPYREGTWNGKYVFEDYEIPKSERIYLTQIEWGLFFDLLIEDSVFREKIVKINETFNLGMWKTSQRFWSGDENRFKEWNRWESTDMIISFNFIKEIPVNSLELLQKGHKAISLLSPEIKQLITMNLQMELKWFDFISKFIPWYVEESDDNYNKEISIEIESNTFAGNSMDSKFASLIKFHSDIDVETYRLNSSSRITTAFVWNNEFYIKKSQAKEFTLVGTVQAHAAANKLIILYSQKDGPNDAIVAVLKYMKENMKQLNCLNDDILKYFEHYIPLKPIGMSVDPKIYQDILKNKEQKYDNTNFRMIDEVNISRMSYQDLLFLLAAKGSYNQQCPCCRKNIANLNHLSVCTLPLNNDFQEYALVLLCINCEKSFRETLLYVDLRDDSLEIATKYYADTSDFIKNFYHIPLSPLNRILNKNSAIVL